MPCCTFCRGTIPLPRYTEPEFRTLEKDHVVYHQWLYFTCPKCKKEEMMELTWEVVSDDGSAVQEVRKYLSRQNKKWIVPEVLSKGSGRKSYLPGKGEGTPIPVPKVQRKTGNL